MSLLLNIDIQCEQTTCSASVTSCKTAEALLSRYNDDNGVPIGATEKDLAVVKKDKELYKRLSAMHSAMRLTWGSVTAVAKILNETPQEDKNLVVDGRGYWHDETNLMKCAEKGKWA
jgi:hypothetical protein